MSEAVTLLSEMEKEFYLKGDSEMSRELLNIMNLLKDDLEDKYEDGKEDGFNSGYEVGLDDAEDEIRDEYREKIVDWKDEFIYKLESLDVKEGVIELARSVAV